MRKIKIYEDVFEVPDEYYLASLKVFIDTAHSYAVILLQAIHGSPDITGGRIKNLWRERGQQQIEDMIALVQDSKLQQLIRSLGDEIEYMVEVDNQLVDAMAKFVNYPKPQTSLHRELLAHKADGLWNSSGRHGFFVVETNQILAQKMRKCYDKTTELKVQIWTAFDKLIESNGQEALTVQIRIHEEVFDVYKNRYWSTLKGHLGKIYVSAKQLTSRYSRRNVPDITDYAKTRWREHGVYQVNDLIQLVENEVLKKLLISLRKEIQTVVNLDDQLFDSLANFLKYPQPMTKEDKNMMADHIHFTSMNSWYGSAEYKETVFEIKKHHKMIQKLEQKTDREFARLIKENNQKL